MPVEEKIWQVPTVEKYSSAESSLGQTEVSSGHLISEN